MQKLQTQEWAGALKALILDMDGVLWRADQPIGDLPSVFAAINAMGCRVLLATNNSTRSISMYVQRLASFGVHLEPWQVINSAQAVAHYLKGLFPGGGPVYRIGEEGLDSALAEYGFHHSEQGGQAVVVGMDRQVNYARLAAASRLIWAGVPFVATNGDRTFPVPDGLVPGAGAILAALETATDVKPMVLGKPAPGMYLVALERFGVAPQEALVVGDRLETDIAGAQDIGCLTALVLSGVTTPEQAAVWQPQPDVIAPDLTTLVEAVSAWRRGQAAAAPSTASSPMNGHAAPG